MRHLARLSVCSLALPLLLGWVSGCYPDSDKIRNQVAQQPDTAVTPSPDAYVPVQLDGPSAVDLAVDRSTPDVPVPIVDTNPVKLDVAIPDSPPDRAPDAVPDAAPDRAPDTAPDVAGDTADAGGSLASRCKAYATGFCKTYATCGQAGLAYDYDTQDFCVTRIEMGCNIWGALDGATWPTAECGAGWTTLSCKDFLDGFEPEGCYAPGLRPQGAACDVDYQCQGRRCIFFTGNSCGICNDRSPAGGSCISDDSCKRGLVCGTKGCVLPGAVGDTCDDVRPCADSLICNSAGKCMAKLLQDTQCDTTSIYDQCDWRSTSVRCSPYSATCRKATSSTASCGWDKGTDTYKFCSARRTCVSSICVAVADVGKACDSSSGPKCMYPVYCDSDSATCVQPGPDNLICK
jgi:hypothetical protein